MSAASTRARRTSLQTRLSFFNDVLNRVFTARARGKSWCGALCRITAGVDFGRVRWGADTLSPAPKAGASAAEDKPRSRTSWWSRRGRTNAVHALLAARRAHTVLTPPSAPDGAQHASPAESRRLEAGAGAPTPASPAIALSPAARSAAQPRCIAFSYRKCSVTVVQLPRCLQKKRCQSCICTRLETCVLGNRKCSFQLLSYQCDSLSA
jgi:hypothetical protein